MRLIAALRSPCRDERGFTMLTVIVVMFCVTLLSVAALSAAQNDLKPGSHDRARKIAYAAAEAGVQNYVYHLSQDLDYWAKCTTGALPNAVNDPWNGTSPADDPRRWMAIPGSTARYTIELLPAGGAAACSTAAPAATMIDGDSGSFKIRSTGSDRAGGVKRSIIATFRRKSLLDYLYFTDKETRPPDLYAMSVASRTTREDGNPSRNLLGWAAASCDRYWGDDPALGNRGSQRFSGDFLHQTDGTWHHFDLSCVELGFNSTEVVAGPLHTNDELHNDCPTPILGDSIDDPIETSSLGQLPVTPANPRGGFLTACSDPDSRVNFSDTATPSASYGTWKPRSPALTLPVTNDALLGDTASAYRFKGTTRITMSGTSMHVTGKRMSDGSAVDTSMAIPADGVVYVANDGYCPAYTPVDSGGAPSTCGNLELQGDYAANVTLTAQNDIVVMNDVKRTTTGSPFLMGLIATNYVRVYHPVTGCTPASPVTCNNVTGCTNGAGSHHDVSIDAAILSLTRSFMVDNWFCGAMQGELRVLGAIAQKFHGPVVGELRRSGYDKVFTYDNQLRYRAPPHYLDPVNAQWRVQTFSEQVPAR
ncbi:MAG: hypothetical protein QOG94_1490 [Solirubrobacteraceae bacterium]|jgi:type II secretory pathway pseudopilin PulG|nr:hypothetical protein [Solirubrobacteraceae bacterium]MEA2138884.1 hypothetical protein [Solirubrobacteraceae bacterium]